MHWKVFICVLFTGITSDSSKPRLISFFILSYQIVVYGKKISVNYSLFCNMQRSTKQ